MRLLKTRQKDKMRAGANSRPVVTPEVLSALLVKQLSSEVNLQLINKAIIDKPVEMKSLVENELKTMLIVANIFAIKQSFDNVTEKDEILKCFCSWWNYIAETQFHMKPEEFMPFIEGRIREYEIAWDTPHHSGPFWMIGQTYAKYVGSPLSAIITHEGGTFFAAELNFKIRALKEIQTKNKIIPPEN